MLVLLLYYGHCIILYYIPGYCQAEYYSVRCKCCMSNDFFFFINYIWMLRTEK